MRFATLLLLTASLAFGKKITAKHHQPVHTTLQDTELVITRLNKDEESCACECGCGCDCEGGCTCDTCNLITLAQCDGDTCTCGGACTCGQNLHQHDHDNILA